MWGAVAAGPRSVRSGRPVPVGAPSPARNVRSSPRDAGRTPAPRVRLDPSPRRGGWVGCTTEFRGRPGSRPRLGGTPDHDESVTAGCNATGCGAEPDHGVARDDHGETTPTRRPLISENVT